MRRPARPELVIFDCDGVLVDSERLSVTVEVQILAELGWEITPEEVVDLFVGVSDDDYLALLEARLGRRLPANWRQEMTPRYRSAFERELRPVNGIEELLDDLAGAGVATCVASNGDHEKIRHSLVLTGLWPRFEGRIFSAYDVARGKPAPDLFLHAAERLGVEPFSCVVVEDSPSGLQAGLAAGMRTLAYAGGVVPIDRLSIDGVTVVKDMSQLKSELLASDDQRPGDAG